MYNGDGPADEFGAALPGIAAALCADLSRKATCDDVRACLDAYIAEHYPDVKHAAVAPSAGPAEETAMSLAVEGVAKEYREAWDREPYPEELRAALNFVLGPHEERGEVVFRTDSTVCPGCGTENSENENQCAECGEALP